MISHLELTGVTRYFGRPEAPVLHALGPISFSLQKGEFFSIVGPSGCGKSTLLEIVAGLSGPTDGDVTFEGKQVNGIVPDGVGVVFQEDASFPWLTVRQNIAFGLKRRGVTPQEANERINQALKLTGLQDFADSYPSQLSGGMRQRVCISRTLVLQPRLILLDEPFGALDQQTRLLMGDQLLDLWRATNATVLLITHSLDEATMLSDRIAVMSTRPGRFLEIIKTNWPANRDSKIFEESEFGHITARLWSLLRDESLKAMGNAVSIK